jgi:hypothetical protein
MVSDPLITIEGLHAKAVPTAVALIARAETAATTRPAENALRIEKLLTRTPKPTKSFIACHAKGANGLENVDVVCVQGVAGER